MTTQGISFSILTFNRLSMLQQTIHSIMAGLAPEEAFEIIIVDDGSTDPDVISYLEEIEHVKSAELFRVLRKDHDLQMPESWARNVTRGFQAAKYNILWHFDDDTLIHGPPNWASHVAHLLRSHPEVGTLAPYRTGIMEPFVPTKHGYELSFGLTEPCFALRRDTFDKLGPVDESLRWYFGPDYSLRVMEDLKLECCFWKGAKQIDLFPRTGMPTDTFPRADGGPYMKKWCDRFGIGEHAWPPFVRHRERIARGKK